jgi:hypothetical protein
MHHFKGWAVLAAAAGVALATLPAHAEGFLSGVMSEFSLSGPKHASIDYHERAPLVVPKSTELPKPEAGNPATAAAAWPKDDDGLNAADREDADPNVPETERWRYKAVTTGQWPVSPAELNSGTRAARVQDDLNLPTGFSQYPDGRLSREQLRAGTKAEAKVSAYAGEPPRRQLTDPPSGYRVPAADAPWGPGHAVVKPCRYDPYAANEAADRALQAAPPR